MLIDKQNIESIFRDFAKILKKKNRNNGLSCELIVVGGASVLLNYGFRETTEDIDCYDMNGALMNEIIKEIADKYNLPIDWINTDFMKTASYTPKIIQYSSFYKSYGNGVLNIRTIKDEYLIAIKMVSGRKYKTDYSDIVGIIKTCKDNGTLITFEQIETALKNLYGNADLVKPEVIAFVKKQLEVSESNYSLVREVEINNRAKLIESKINHPGIKTEEIDKELEEIK